MPTATRSRTFAVAHADLWELIADPHHQPRWWPGVERRESAAKDAFTQALKTKRAKPIRADFLVTAVEPPWMTVWEQQIPGTPFARVLKESVIQVNLEPAGAGA